MSWAPRLSLAHSCCRHGARYMATLQKRKPSRMVLSQDVARQNSPPPGAGARRRQQDPFGGLNKTVANIDPVRKGRRTFKGSDKVLPQSKKPREQAFRALKMQKALAPVSYKKRTEVKHSIAARDSFRSFGLLPVILDSIGPQALRGRHDAGPSPIQQLAIPALLGSAKRKGSSADSSSMEQFLLAAETGSGKTLAYLLPTLDALKRSEMLEKQTTSAKEAANVAKRDALFHIAPPEPEKPNEAMGRPRVIILVPTAELVDQVGHLAKSLSHTVKFRTALLSSNYSGQVIHNRLYSPGGVDVVISTPHLLSSIMKSDPNSMSRVTHLIIDEADSLLDRSFSPLTKDILDRAEPSLKQLILCSATIPRQLDHMLATHFPDTVRLTTPNLHAVPRRVQLSVVDIEGQPYHGNRKLACADTVVNMGKEAATDGERVLRVIAFVNERETTEELVSFLTSKGIDAIGLNRDASDRHSVDVLADFTGAPSTSKRKDDKDASASTSLSGPRFSRASNVKVLVMTDIGSRGIDTLEVRNVILYDVPHTSIDFIHRLGRVGRMGRRGRGIVLVGKNDRRDIVKEVRTGMFMGKALI